MSVRKRVKLHRSEILMEFVTNVICCVQDNLVSHRLSAGDEYRPYISFVNFADDKEITYELRWDYAMSCMLPNRGVLADNTICDIDMLTEHEILVGITSFSRKLVVKIAGPVVAIYRIGQQMHEIAQRYQLKYTASRNNSSESPVHDFMVEMGMPY